MFFTILLTLWFAGTFVFYALFVVSARAERAAETMYLHQLDLERLQSLSVVVIELEQ